MRACLDLHDFSAVHCRLEVLFALKDYFKDFKVSLFTVPIDEKKDWGSSLIREDNLTIIKNNLDWMQIIPHGLQHNGSEMASCDYFTFKEQIIPSIEEAFNKDGLPFVKGFVAPHWRWTEGVVRALDEQGWWGAIDRDKVIPCPKKYYQYNYLLNEPFYDSQEDLKLHGHIYGTKNDVGKCFNNLLKLPKDTEWHFVTDFLSK
jgi:hypothetical protein